MRARRFLLRLFGAAPLFACVVLSAQPQNRPDLIFHHLHVRDNPPAFRIAFYERLFDRGVTSRVTFAGVAGLRMGSRVILVSQSTLEADFPAALWHFGWGQASLGENYLAHARREVAWEPPLPPEDLHIHLRSVRPSSAAAWYRDVLGGSVETPPVMPRSDAPLPPPEYRQPEALVRIGGMALLVYRTEGPLVSSVGQQIDHLAFACTDLVSTLAYLRTKRVVPGEVIEADGVRSAMIVGPDRIAIELVEAP